MTEPLRIQCRDLNDVPEVGELQSLADEARNVVLEFPKEFAGKRAVIECLTPQLPDHSVFYSGGSHDSFRVTVKRVAARSKVLALLPSVRQALDSYIETCSRLLREYRADRVSDSWKTFEHGGHVQFKNLESGLVVEVPLAGPPTLQDCDPYFFAQFVVSSREHEDVSRLLADHYHDGQRVLEVLRQTTD